MTSELKVIKPVAVTIDSSNVAEDDALAWDAGTTYATGDEVIYDHAIWRSAADSNTGNTPDAATAFWARLRATNRYRCLDLKQTSPTTNAGTIEMTLVSGGIGDAIAFVGLDASTVEIEVVDDGTTTFGPTTYDLISSENVIDMWSYTYGAFEYEDELIVSLPIFTGVEINITIDGGAGSASVGEIIAGQTHSLGISTADTVGITDYSTKEQDEFGDWTIVEREYSFDHEFQFAFPKEDRRRVNRLMAELRVTPSLFFAAEDNMEFGTTVFGFLGDWETPLDSDGYVFATAPVKGLT